MLIVSNCAEEVVENKEVPQQVVSKKFPDLSLAIQKRVEKKPEEAIEILRQYDQDFPNSPKILVQLSRAHVEAGNFSLAAFRFEQALSISSSPDLIGECAEAHLRADDLESARKRFSEYLEFTPDNFEAWLSLARILEQQGNEIQALNAFEQAKKITNSKKNKISQLLKSLLSEKKQIILSLSEDYKDSYTKKLLKKIQKYKFINLIGMGGSILGARAINSFTQSKLKINFIDEYHHRLNKNNLDS